MGALLGVTSQLRPPRIDTNSSVKRESSAGNASLSQLLLTSPFSSSDGARFTPNDALGQPNANPAAIGSSAAAGESFSSATAESPVSQAVRETRRQGTRMQEGEQVPLSVLPYFRFLSEEAQRNVMSQLIDNFQTTSIAKRGVTSAASTSSSSPEGLAFMRSPFAKSLAPGVSASTGTATSSRNGSSSPPFDAMMVDNSSNAHRRETGVDCSREIGASSVSAAVAAVVATPPAHAEMHRVLSAPMLSPPANSARGGTGMDQNRLPPLRQETGDGRKPGGFHGSSTRENGSSIDMAGAPAGAAGLGRDSTMRSPRSHTRHLSESALPSAAMAAAAAAAMQTEPLEEAGWAPANNIRRAPSR